MGCGSIHLSCFTRTGCIAHELASKHGRWFSKGCHSLAGNPRQYWHSQCSWRYSDSFPFCRKMFSGRSKTLGLRHLVPQSICQCMALQKMLIFLSVRLISLDSRQNLYKKIMNATPMIIPSLLFIIFLNYLFRLVLF